MLTPEAASSMYSYITATVVSMLEASGDMESVDLRLVVGWLAFYDPSITAWLRGQVSGTSECF